MFLLILGSSLLHAGKRKLSLLLILSLRLCVVRENRVSTFCAALLPLPVMGEGRGEGGLSMLRLWNNQVPVDLEGVSERTFEELKG